MSDYIRMWLRWLLIGACLAVLSGADCVDKLRDVSEGLGDLADSIDGGEADEDLGDIFDDIADWFD